jgi:hypothetical protein
MGLSFFNRLLLLNMAEAVAHRTISDFQLKKSKDLPSLRN